MVIVPEGRHVVESWCDAFICFIPLLGFIVLCPAPFCGSFFGCFLEKRLGLAQLGLVAMLAEATEFFCVRATFLGAFRVALLACALSSSVTVSTLDPVVWLEAPGAKSVNLRSILSSLKSSTGSWEVVSCFKSSSSALSISF